MATKKSSGTAAPARTLGETDAHKLTLIGLVVEAIAHRAGQIDRQFFHRDMEASPEAVEVFLDSIRDLVNCIGTLADYGLGSVLDAGQVRGDIEAWLMHPVYRGELARGADEVSHG